jgi:putative transposase
MTATPSIDLSGWLSEQLGEASPDLLRRLISTFVQALMGAEADAICGAGYGLRSEQRTNIRNGYRARDWDTRAGTVELAIPKLRSGSYFPDWLLERRRRAEAAPGVGGGDELPARGVDAADGEAGRDAGHHPAVEVAGH